MNLTTRAQLVVTPRVTRLLRLLGLRDRVYRWRLEGTRSLRRALESRGIDRLSKPALHGMDMRLNAIIDCDNGFFVEAGGHDGFTQSNSYWLERFRRWRGFLIEPIPELAAEARQIRPAATVIECALVASGDSREKIHMRFGDLLSMVDGARDPEWPTIGVAPGWKDAYGVDVQARTLSSLLDELDAPEVDLLSLDVEGFEAVALRGLDMRRHSPRFILVEIHERDRGKPPIDEVLADRYVEHSWLSPIDLLYVRRDISDH